MATTFSGGGRRSTRREPPTMGMQLVSFITCGCGSSASFCNLPSLCEPTFSFDFLLQSGGAVVAVIVCWLDLQLPMQSVHMPLTLRVRTPLKWSVQHHVIKFVSDLQQVSCFHGVLLFPPPIKLTATIYLKYWLKVPLNSISQTNQPWKKQITRQN